MPRSCLKRCFVGGSTILSLEPATYLQPGSCVQPLCTLCTVLTSRESQSRVL